MKGLSGYELRQLILSVGTHRSDRPLSPVEVAKLMRRALDMGETRKTLADRLLLDDSSIIGRFIRLLSLSVQVQLLIGWGSNPDTISFTAASDIARLDYPEEQKTLAKMALENQFNKSEIIECVQLRQRSERSIEDCVKAVLGQRPVIERRHVIIGELKPENLKDRLKEMSQLERDNLLESALDEYGPSVPRLGAKLGNGYFLLVGDDRFHAEITSLPNGFEESISRYLIQKLDDKD